VAPRRSADWLYDIEIVSDDGMFEHWCSGPTSAAPRRLTVKESR